MSIVFISYRRDDTAPYAGRIYDRLKEHFGVEQVFMDIDRLKPGEDFVEAIDRTVRACEIAIILIGRSWLTVTDAQGKRRLDDPNDFVRLEVAAALDRNVKVVPVLVGGASMPSVSQLPESLSALARRHAVDISDTRFHSDVDRLIAGLPIAEKDEIKTESPAPVRTTRGSLHWPWVVAIVIGVIMLTIYVVSGPYVTTKLLLPSQSVPPDDLPKPGANIPLIPGPAQIPAGKSDAPTDSLGPYPTMARAEEQVKELRAKGIDSVALRKGDGYYVDIIPP